MREAAADYIARGWRIVPIPAGLKRPMAENWQNRIFAATDIAANIGVVLGPSKLVDIDLDDPKAAELAWQYLPETGAVFGRPGKPRSHWIYQVDNPLPSRRLSGADRKSIVEYRSFREGSTTGAQTVFPPSIHPSGELISWEGATIAPTVVDGKELMAAVERLAEAVKATQANGGAAGGNLSFDAAGVPATQGISPQARCRAYLAKCPDAVSGAGGSNATLLAACECFRFGLSASEAWEIMQWWNAEKCKPRWSDKELSHKIADAEKKVGADGEIGKRLAGNYAPEGREFSAENRTPLSDGSGGLATLMASLTPYVPFPVNSLPMVLRDFVMEGAAAIPCDPAQLALPVLVACSSAIGITRRIVLKKTWKEPATLWGAIILPSGSRKTPSLNLALSPLRELQEKAFARHREAMKEYECQHDIYKKQGGEEPHKPICERFIVSDATIEALVDRLQTAPRGLLCERDELSGWLASFDAYRSGRGGDVAHWLTMHGAGSISVDRKGNEKPIYCKYGFVSLLGGVQPGILKRGLTNENLENGLAARILMAMPEAIHAAWTEDDVCDATKDAYCDLIHGLRDIPLNGPPAEAEPFDIPLSAGAKKLWVDFYNEQNAGGEDGRKPNVSAMWSKIEGYCARLALILSTVRAVSEGIDCGAIDERSMQDGITLANWFGKEAERVYRVIGQQGAVDDKSQLVAFIKKAGGKTSASELAHGIRKYRGAGVAADALAKLAADSLGAWDGNQFILS